MLKIIPLLALKDNYIWLVINSNLSQAIAIDPGDACPVLSFLEENNLTLVGVLVTHKHADHTAGICKLLNVYPGIPVYSHPIENVPLTTHLIKNDEVITIAQWPISFKVIHIPGHTLGHVAFYSHPILFTGDTLFGAGCGRVFEGTAEEMYSSLNKLMMLPNDTLIYCGHEYTLANLNFALHLEPKNINILKRINATTKMRENDIPSLPSTMSIEKLTNPFLRCTHKDIIERAQEHANRKLISSVDVFHELREWKNKL